MPLIARPISVNRRPLRIVFQWALVALLLLGAAFACAPDARRNTKAATASGNALPLPKGYILTSPNGRSIVSLQLPESRPATVHPGWPSNEDDMPTVAMLSGPDASGRVAYIEDHFFVSDKKNRRHLLKTIELDGSHDTEIFSRSGDAMWASSPAGKGEIGQHLALSPTGGRVAFLSGLSPVQMPSAYLHTGTIEIWDVKTRKGKPLVVDALDQGLSWFPDGSQLAYVRLVQTHDPSIRTDDREPTSFVTRGWERVPAVFARNVETGIETFIGVGWNPIVSTDGRHVLIGEFDGGWRCVDTATHTSTHVKWLGDGKPIAILGAETVLSWCPPLEGEKIELTQNNSPLVGPKKMLSLKLVTINRAQAQTLIPQIDPRTQVSFGQVQER